MEGIVMGKLEEQLQEKIKKREEEKALSGEEALSGKEASLKEKSQGLANALVFLEKTILDARKGWYIDSNKALEGNGLWGKLGAFRRKLQRKSLHWYMEPVCDDQSVYNQKITRALDALEDFAKAQADWNQEMEKMYRQEVMSLKEENAFLKEENAAMKEQLAKRQTTEGGFHEG